MDNLITDGLCSVGLLYLLLHLWRSTSTIGQGVKHSSVPAAEDVSEHCPLSGSEAVRSGKSTVERADRL